MSLDIHMSVWDPQMTSLGLDTLWVHNTKSRHDL